MSTYKKSIIAGQDIYNFIPQKPPMVMVDKLFFNDETTTISGLTVSEDNIFCKNQHLSEPGLIENIAQTVALGSGYRMISQGNNQSPLIGFIGSVKNLNVYYLPEISENLVTQVVITHKVMDAAVVSGKITSDEKLVAECEMNIFSQKNT